MSGLTACERAKPHWKSDQTLTLTLTLGLSLSVDVLELFHVLEGPWFDEERHIIRRRQRRQWGYVRGLGGLGTHMALRLERTAISVGIVPVNRGLSFNHLLVQPQTPVVGSPFTYP